MHLLLATTNPHKAREFAELLTPLGVQLRTLADAGSTLPEPSEDGPTFEANARIKATFYARALGCTCLADDSGLEVDALGGAPGVRSARYAGHAGPRDERDRRNRERLVGDLRRIGGFGGPARLVCALCLADERGQVAFETRAALEGRFVEHASGEHGFGYDSHLFLDDVGKTAAQLSPAEMNARSHRGQATRQLAAWLGQRA